MKKNFLYISAIVSLLSLFTRCDMPHLEPERSSGKAEVRVQIGTANTQARTVSPTVALEDVSAWELRGAKQGNTETLLAEFSSAQGTTINLETGTWSFTLKGYKDSALILSGNIAEQTISLDATNVLEFSVAPALEETGSISIVINLPADSGITTARVFRDGTELSPSLTPADNQITFSNTAHTTGDYYFSIHLYKGADRYGVVSEVVQVRANLESAKTYTITQEDLKYVYVISYHLWEGETETGYYQYTDAAVTLPTPTRAGYVFEGWYATADFSGDPLTQVPAGSTGDKDFYAKWSVVQYTVTFDADGGSPATQPLTVNAPSITNITYSSVSGGEWTLQDDGRRQSPAIGHGSVTKARISFTSTVANASITIQLDVSSESGCDYAFISTLDNASATYSSGYYTGSLISGTQTVTVTIPVPTAGDHFIDIGYRKDGSVVNGSDCAWFKVTDISGGNSLANMPTEPTRSGYGFGGWYTAQNGGGTEFTTDTLVTADITVYAKWLPDTSIQISSRPAGDDISLSDTSISVNQQAQFSVADGYNAYTWFWAGEAIVGETSSTYTLAANSSPSGIYELSVVVTTATGEKLSARCRVTITAF